MILPLDIIQNERGVTLLATIILLFFISLFLLSITLWHDSLYRNFNALETYYEQQAIDYMNRVFVETEYLIEESQSLDDLEVEADLSEEEMPTPEVDVKK